MFCAIARCDGYFTLCVGGRNVTVSMMSRATHDADMAAVVGMLLFSQHFFWYDEFLIRI